MLARGGSVAQDIESVLATIAGTLDARECVLWLVAPAGIERGWAIGDEETNPELVRDLLDGDDSERDDLIVARLHTGEQRLGALTVRVQRELADDERLFFSTVADVLAPVLRDAAYTHSLQTKVLERTRALEDQRRFTAKIIDSLPVGLYVIDRDYRIQAWNHKRETGMQGVSREEALGRPIFEILHRQPEPLLRREFDDVFASGTIQQFQMESNASGELRTYRISKIPMRLDDTDDTISHVITIGEDVTEWRDAQERFAQAEKLAAIGTLAAGVMHEINNPLATIGACAESLTLRVDEGGAAPEPFAGELREMLRVVEHEVHRCKGIVDSLLDFSRPKPATKTTVDVSVVVEKTLFLLKHHSRFKKVGVQTELDRQSPPVYGSEEQLIQVIMALLINAMDAMPDEGKITLRTRRDADAGTVTIEVMDRGTGIRRTDLQKIFEPFYTTKPPGRGTGLGLSICYAIISEHGGRIEVESEVGSGSVFRIVLPKQELQA